MLSIKLLGAILIIGASTWVGLHASRSVKRLDRRLRELCDSLELMKNELCFTNTSFEPLCRRLSESARGEVSTFFRELSQQAGTKDFSPVGAAKRASDAAKLNLPPASFFALERLIDGFGRYDLDGQLRQIELAQQELSAQLARNREDMDSRCRTYELLGICTGAAVIILVI